MTNEPLSQAGQARREQIAQLALRAAVGRRQKRAVVCAGLSVAALLTTGALLAALLPIPTPPNVQRAGQVPVEPVPQPVEEPAVPEPTLLYVQVVDEHAPRSHVQVIASSSRSFVQELSTHQPRHIALVDDAGLLESLEENGLSGGLAYVNDKPRFVSPEHPLREAKR